LKPNGAVDWLTMPPRSETSYVGSLTDLKKWAEVRSEEYLRCAPNFPVIDALSKEGLFNYTVSKAHGIDATACKGVLTTLGVEQDKPLCLYWVVRDGEGKQYPKQKIEPQNIPGEFPKFIESRISQFALEIPTVPYNEMGLEELKELCRKKELRTTGTNAQLISRLSGTETGFTSSPTTKHDHSAVQVKRTKTSDKPKKDLIDSKKPEDMTLAELKAALQEMGHPCSGLKKAELVERLCRASKKPEDMTVAELKAALRDKGLRHSGSRAELVKRLAGE